MSKNEQAYKINTNHIQYFMENCIQVNMYRYLPSQPYMKVNNGVNGSIYHKSQTNNNNTYRPTGISGVKRHET